MVSENIRLGFIVATRYGLFCLVLFVVLLWLVKIDGSVLLWILATGFFCLVLFVVLLWLVKIVGSVLLWLLATGFFV